MSALKGVFISRSQVRVTGALRSRSVFLSEEALWLSRRPAKTMEHPRGRQAPCWGAGVVRTTKQQPAQEPQACGLPGPGPHAAGAGGGALGKVLNSSVPQGPSQPHGNELVQVRHSILLEEQPGS